MKDLDANPNQFADMDYIVYWQSLINTIESLLLFVIWIKLFRFLNMSRTMGQLAGTLRRVFFFDKFLFRDFLNFHLFDKICYLLLRFG